MRDKAMEKEKLKNLFDAIDVNKRKYILKEDVLNIFYNRGIDHKDERISEIVEALSHYSRQDKITYHKFIEIIGVNLITVLRIVRDDLVVPRFNKFREGIEEIYNEVKENRGGTVAQYIPQLARVNPEYFAVSICTVDNQQLSFGDADVRYCVQSTCKPINYCIAMEINGVDYVHNHIGREPSGRGFNEITLTNDQLPHNPMINAGAIMSTALIFPEDSLADRFDKVTSYWKDLSGGVSPGYNNSVYHSERETADRNIALAHFMRENGAFPENTDLAKTLDFYFQCCSIEVTNENMARIAASLANAGVCPTTKKVIFSPQIVKNCLSLMYSCGMYDFSGEFAFTVGLPAKSGVSGALLIIVPNVMGIAVWSPRLDKIGNSVRGVEFCKKLVQKYALHNYDSILVNTDKVDPRVNHKRENTNIVYNMIQAASEGDLGEMQRLQVSGATVNDKDYDFRTPLHLAAAEGQLQVVKYLIDAGAEIDCKDRFGHTPLDDARKNKRQEVVDLLMQAKKSNKPTPAKSSKATTEK